MKFKFSWSGNVVMNHTGFNVTCTSHLSFGIRRSAEMSVFPDSQRYYIYYLLVFMYLLNYAYQQVFFLNIRLFFLYLVYETLYLYNLHHVQELMLPIACH